MACPLIWLVTVFVAQKVEQKGTKKLSRSSTCNLSSLSMRVGHMGSFNAPL